MLGEHATQTALCQFLQLCKVDFNWAVLDKAHSTVLLLFQQPHLYYYSDRRQPSAVLLPLLQASADTAYT